MSRAKFGNVITMPGVESAFEGESNDIQSGQNVPSGALAVTSIALAVTGAIEYARALGDVAVAYGPPGIGKTAAAQRYMRSVDRWRPPAFLVTATPTTSELCSFLYAVCGELDLYSSWRAMEMTSRIVAKLDTEGEGGMVLIVDCAHLLKPTVLDHLGSIHDATGAGVVLLGNEGLYSSIYRKAGDTAETLRSRIGKQLKLTAPSAEDVAAVLDCRGVRTKVSRAALAAIGTGPNGLRRVDKVLRLAAQMATGRTVTDAHISAAICEVSSR